MPKNFCALILLFFICCSAFAQKTNISGAIKDTTSNKFVQYAVVAIISQEDSTLISFTRSKANGAFSLSLRKPGKYVFMVTHPSFADYVEDFETNGKDIQMNTVPMTPKSKLLEAIIIKSGNPIRIKGDTTIYTADSFKVSANANVEDLLKKMPGIQVDKNGEIKAMGETVEKVLVDGEEFFGDDPGMAVKNLRADAIKEVQVFKKKSDQAEFTGIDDGQSKQTINLKLKEDKKHGYFGKVDAAGGLQKNIDDRYNTNLLFGSFKGKRKLSAFLLNGNTGQDGLSWRDMEKYGGMDNSNVEMMDDGGVMITRQGSSDDEPYIDTDDGYTTNINGGIQYSNKFGKNSLNLSPKFNSQVNDNNKYRYYQTLLENDSSLNETTQSSTHMNRYNLKMSGIYDMVLDSNNSLKVSLQANVYHTETAEVKNVLTLDQDNNRVNSSDRKLNTSSDKEAYSASALYKHKFKKARRTLSLNMSYYLQQRDADNYMSSDNLFYRGAGVDTLRQHQFRNGNSTTNTANAKALYTEPLSKAYSLEIGHELSVNKGKNDQVTYAYTPATGKFDHLLDSLSNDFDQIITVNKPSLKLNYSDKKLKYNLGSGFGFTSFDLQNHTTGQKYIRHYTNFFPQAFLSYSYKSNSSLRFNYNGSTQQPTINQLQPITNNDNPLLQYLGNPDLKPSFNHSFNVSHNSYNFLKERWMYQSIYANVRSNSITNNRVIDKTTGITTIQPINTDGNISLGLWSGLGLKLKKLNMRVNLNPGFNFSRYADIINSNKYFTENLSGSLQASVSKSKDKKYDVTLSNAYTINSNKSSISPDKISFSTNTLSADATVYYKKVWSINTDYNYYYREKTSALQKSLNNNLWNAKLQRTFKDNEFTAYFIVRDILNQNIGITRNFSGNTFTEERNDRLKRYFMLGFTWDFKNKAPKAK